MIYSGNVWYTPYLDLGTLGDMIGSDNCIFYTIPAVIFFSTMEHVVHLNICDLFILQGSNMSRMVGNRLRSPTIMMVRRKKRRMVESHFRGVEGERFVLERLQEYRLMLANASEQLQIPFRSRIVNTSKEAYLGDFHWIEKDFRLLIEVKNVRSLGPKQMERFEQNVYKGWSSGLIQGALLVNVDFVNVLPGASEHMDMYLATVIPNQNEASSSSDIPIILIRDAKKRPELLFFALNMMRHLCRVNSNQSRCD